MSVRPADLDDAAAIAAIYSEAIEERVATFRTEPVTTRRVEEMLVVAGELPFLAAERDGAVAGFAVVSPYSAFPPYAGVGEYMIYVAREARGQGVGRELLGALCEQAQRAGLHKLTGKLFADNVASIELAHRCGFRDVGTHLRHGRLEGQWKDVLIVERTIGGPDG